MTTVLPFPANRAMKRTAGGESAGPHIDQILKTPLTKVPKIGAPGYGAQRSKAIRNVFRALGWTKFFRVTKGGFSLGASIEWADGYKPVWHCDWVESKMEERRQSNVYIDIPVCGCATCRHREAQREAVRRRVHYVLNMAFSHPGTREFGDRSDAMTDYFDSDYTFYP